jgi:hypothetical protein
MSTRRGGRRRQSYDLQETSRRLERSEWVVRQLIKKGVLVAWKIGGRLAIDADSVDALARGEVDGQAA